MALKNQEALGKLLLALLAEHRGRGLTWKNTKLSAMHDLAIRSQMIEALPDNPKDFVKDHAEVYKSELRGRKAEGDTYAARMLQQITDKEEI